MFQYQPFVLEGDTSSEAKCDCEDYDCEDRQTCSPRNHDCACRGACCQARNHRDLSQSFTLLPPPDLIEVERDERELVPA